MDQIIECYHPVSNRGPSSPSNGSIWVTLEPTIHQAQACHVLLVVVREEEKRKKGSQKRTLDQNNECSHPVSNRGPSPSNAFIRVTLEPAIHQAQACHVLLVGVACSSERKKRGKKVFRRGLLDQNNECSHPDWNRGRAKRSAPRELLNAPTRS